MGNKNIFLTLVISQQMQLVKLDTKSAHYLLTPLMHRFIRRLRGRNVLSALERKPGLDYFYSALETVTVEHFCTSSFSKVSQVLVVYVSNCLFQIA